MLQYYYYYLCCTILDDKYELMICKIALLPLLAERQVSICDVTHWDRLVTWCEFPNR